MMRQGITMAEGKAIGHLLLASLMMSSYESIAHGSHGGSPTSQTQVMTDIAGVRTWNPVCHYDGTLALLRLHRERGNGDDLAFYRAVRRPVVSTSHYTNSSCSWMDLLCGLQRLAWQIRGYILLGKVVPDWLRDGAVYGEVGPILELDKLMVRCATLRSKALKVSDDVQHPSLDCREEHTAVLVQAQELDDALTTWADGVTGKSWTLKVHDISEHAGAVFSWYDSTVYTFKTHAHAIVWMRYWALRLIALSICIDSPSLQTQQRERYLQSVASCATNMCRTIPFFFMEGTTMSTPLLPRRATLLTWPVAVAVSTSAMPFLQREWLRDRLRAIANAKRDRALLSIVEQGGFTI
jgi:hypothetical protein